MMEAYRARRGTISKFYGIDASQSLRRRTRTRRAGITKEAQLPNIEDAQSMEQQS